VSAATQFLNKYVIPPLTALSENTYLSAIRAGMVSVVPMTIIGGLFMIVTNLPVPGWEETVRPMAHLLELPVTAMFGAVGGLCLFCDRLRPGQAVEAGGGGERLDGDADVPDDPA
jgi:cellobiose-specific phosphotransferase system component IIC